MQQWVGRFGKGMTSGTFLVCAIAALLQAGSINCVAANATDTNAPAGDTTITAAATNSVAITNAPAKPAITNETSATPEPPTNRTAATIAPKPVTPGHLTVKPGFKVEVVAEAPEVVMPVAMAFDEDSRLYVVEMRDYPSERDSSPHLGQIRVLEDLLGEGKFTSSTVFVTNLPLPSAIVCYGGGVFVAAAPDILYLQDTDGNGVADLQRVVFTGFGDTNSMNADGLPHSFYWGMDNRIYGATGAGGAAVRSPDAGGDPMILNGLDFSIDPRNLTLGAESGSALSGLTRDDWGRRYLTSFTRPLSVEMIEYRFLQRNPLYPAAVMVDECMSPAVPVFRHSTGPRPVAIPLRQAGATNLFVSSWMTRARGSAIYRGSLFPTNYLGNVFIADPEAHVVHRAVLRDVGLQVRAERSPEDRSTEFIVSTSPDFRPSQIVNGPDGALYISDIGKGKDSGRIYRVSPITHRAGKLPSLSEANAIELVAALTSTNGWHRDTAARLIFEQRNPNTIKMLGSVATGARIPVVRAHAMYALAGMGALTEGQMALLLGDPDPRVRANAARLLEGFVQNGRISDLLWSRLRTLSGEPYIQVRYAAALTAGSVVRPDKARLLVTALAPEPGNPWMQTAVLSSAGDSAAAVLIDSFREARLRTPAGAAFQVRLADMIGVSGIQADIAAVIDFLDQGNLAPNAALGVLAALGDGLQRTRSSLAMVDPERRLSRFYMAALNLSADITAEENLRLDAIRVLGVGPYTMADGGQILLAIIGGSDGAAIQSAALQALARYTDPMVTPSLVRRWSDIPASLRGQAVSALLRRTDRIPAVLAMLKSQELPPGDFLPWQVNMLRSLRDLSLRDGALAIFGPARSLDAAALARLKPSLNSTGAASRGRQVFDTRCALCHTIGSVVPSVAPDLAGIKVYGKESILQAIASPNLKISPAHRTVVATTGSGETLVGTVDQVDRGALLLRRPGRPTTAWPRSNVIDVQTQSWSLMPEEIAAGMTPQNMADLLQYFMLIP